MTRPLDKIIAVLAAIGLIALLATSSIWGPTVDNIECGPKRVKV